MQGMVVDVVDAVHMLWSTKTSTAFIFGIGFLIRLVVTTIIFVRS